MAAVSSYFQNMEDWAQQNNNFTTNVYCMLVRRFV